MSLTPEDGEGVEMDVVSVRMVVGPDGKVRLPSFSLASYIVLGVGDLERMLTLAHGMGRTYDG